MTGTENTVSTFKTIAEQAAQAERVRDYRGAFELWSQALPLAVSAENQFWADARLEFCRKLTGGSV